MSDDFWLGVIATLAALDVAGWTIYVARHGPTGDGWAVWWHDVRGPTDFFEWVVVLVMPVIAVLSFSGYTAMAIVLPIAFVVALGSLIGWILTGVIAGGIVALIVGFVIFEWWDSRRFETDQEPEVAVRIDG